jgi:hypothetical protein
MAESAITEHVTKEAYAGGAVPELTREDRPPDVAAEIAPTQTQTSDNVFAVLAQRASERRPAELWGTAVAGTVNAVFVFTQHPALHWLGAGFAAAAAYGIWGLTNRAIVTPRTRLSNVQLDLLRGVRGMMVPIGVISALAAVGSFMAVALGGWIH